MMKLRSLAWMAVLLSSVASYAMGHRFHAAALILGGDEIPSVGSVSLAATGGRGANVVRDYDDGFVRFAEATSAVSGAREGDVALTSSVVTVRDLEIGGRIHADLLVARVNERHPSAAGEAEITFEGSHIDHLTVDGTPVDATLDAAFFALHPTFVSMTDGQGDRSATVICSARGVAACGMERDSAWGIRIADFGTLTIGEVFVKFGYRQLNMLRFDREQTTRLAGRLHLVANGSSDPQSLIVGGVEGNGTPTGP